MSTSMKKLAYFILCAIVGLLLINAQPAPNEAAIKASAIQSITAKDLSEYLHIVASDSMEGRATGERGQKKTATYLAAKFKEFGLLPAVPTDSGNSYFQKFALIEKKWG